MKKRIARIVVYFTLACFAAFVVTHPYVWQNVFGPKIKGEPLWAWQQEFRAKYSSDPGTNTFWGKVCSFLRLRSRPVQWIGYFPSDDAEMLPVLVSLADDADDVIRIYVALSLGDMPPDEQTMALLVHMLDDPDERTRMGALYGLQKYGPKGAVALPKTTKLMKGANPETRILAALAVVEAGSDAPEAFEEVRAALKSPTGTVRQKAVRGISGRFKDDDTVFASLTDLAYNDPDGGTRQLSILALGHFGRRATPVLISFLQDEHKIKAAPKFLGRQRVNVIKRLGALGPDAHEAVPVLEKLAEHPDSDTRDAAAAALKRIDPKRAAEK